MYSGNQVSYDNLNENMKQKFEGLKTSIVNDLTTGGSDKALSAESGKELKNLVDEKADCKDLEFLQTEITKHLADNTTHTKWIETVGGTANALTATLDGLTSYKNGLGVSFPVKLSSTAAMSLNINGLGAIPIKKANGEAFSNGKANGAYSVRYLSGTFILQGESEVEIGQQIIKPSTTKQTILKGLHDGTGYVEGDSNLIASNILAGKTIFGITGNVQPKQFRTFYINGNNAYETIEWGFPFSVMVVSNGVNTSKHIYLSVDKGMAYGGGNYLPSMGEFYNDTSAKFYFHRDGGTYTIKVYE
ncbi:hypothetical protein [Lysinibacillus xylanilyticus]|uniref:hypothetical protein n=1 Tax=Lysinibacillus xylanilyticus TaxID=582475 RepID=UPI003D06D973